MLMGVEGVRARRASCLCWCFFYFDYKLKSLVLNKRNTSQFSCFVDTDLASFSSSVKCMVIKLFKVSLKTFEK